MFNELDFMQRFGVRVEIPDEHTVRAVIDPVLDIHRGGLQSQAVNGGVLASMFDLALGMPGYIRAFPEGRSATVQLSMQFRKAVKGSRIQTDSWIARGGKSLLFTEAEARDEKGELCATASGVVRVMEGFSGERKF